MKDRIHMTTILLGALLALVSLIHCPPAKAGECAGAPPDAVMKLPLPLSKWGTLICTPYGHIISNKNGWIWSRPGANSPVFFPSQMVRESPSKLGNNSYFTKIEMHQISGDEFEKAYQAYHSGFAQENPLPKGYRLDLTSNSKKELHIDFFEYKTSVWGIWCNKSTCDHDSIFMVLDMSHRPE